MANMMIKYKERQRRETMGIDVFNTVFGWMKDSRWRKRCKSLVNRARSQLLIQKYRREAIIRQSRADIAQLLIHGQLDDSLARVDQLHDDQCILSAYNQIDIYYEIVHANLREICSRSKLSYEVVEAVSSLVFAASRCGELPELNRIRSLFRKHFGIEFERVNVELQSGNFVNSQIKYNLGNNSMSDALKLQMTSEIAGECTLCLQPDQIIEENFVPQYESSGLKIGDFTDNSNGKPQWQASKIKDMVWRIGSKISKSGSRSLISNPTQDKLAVYLDDPKDESSRTDDVNGRNVAKGFGSQNRTVSSKGNNVIKKNLTQMGDQTMLSKEGLPRCRTYGGRRLERNEESKPRLSYVHPKLPDYDELVASFTEYKEEYMKRNSNGRTLSKWMRLF